MGFYFIIFIFYTDLFTLNLIFTPEPSKVILKQKTFHLFIFVVHSVGDWVGVRDCGEKKSVFIG